MELKPIRRVRLTAVDPDKLHASETITIYDATPARAIQLVSEALETLRAARRIVKPARRKGKR